MLDGREPMVIVLAAFRCRGGRFKHIRVIEKEKTEEDGDSEPVRA
jgi:hypothetical protein